MAAKWPKLTVRGNFEDVADTPVWSDLSSRAKRRVTVRRGRQTELQRHEPASAAVTLANQDDELTKDNTGSGFYPNVVPERGLQLGLGYVPHVLALDPEAFWAASEYSGSGSLLDLTGNGHDAAFPGGSADPKFLDWSGTQYLYCPGIGGNFVHRTNYTVSMHGGTTIDLRVRVALEDWTPAATQSPLGANSTRLCLRVLSNGKLHARVLDPSNVSLAGDSTVATGFDDGALRWIRFVFNLSTGALDFYTSDDDTNDHTAVTWTQLGAQVSGTAGSLHTGTNELIVGQSNQVTGDPLAGEVYAAAWLKDGVVVTDPDFTDTAAVVEPFASFVDGQANTWALTRSSSGRKLAVVDRDLLLFGSDDRLDVADASGLDFAAGESFTVLAVFRYFGGTQFAVVDKGRYSLLQNRSGNADRLGVVISDGTDTVDYHTSSTVLNNGELNAAAVVLDRSVEFIRTYNNGAQLGLTSNSTAAVDSLENAGVLRIGDGQAGGNPADMEFVAAAIFRRVLTDAEIAAVSDSMTYGCAGGWIFTGLIDGWLRRFENAGKTKLVEAPAHDALERAGRVRLPSVWRQTIEASTTVTAWLRLGEKRGLVAVDAAGNNHDGTWSKDAAELTTGGLVVGDNSPAAFFDVDERVTIDPDLIDSYPFTIEGVFKAPLIDGSFDDRYIIRFTRMSGSIAESVTVFIQDWAAGEAGKLLGGVQQDSGGVISRAGVTNDRVDDDARHHFALVATSASNILLYLDGVEQPMLTTDAPAIVDYIDATIGNTDTGSPPGDRPFLADLQDIVIHADDALSAATVAAHSDAALAPWEDDTTGARIDRVLDHLGIDAGDRDIDTGNSTLQVAEIDDAFALAHLHDVARAEHGHLFIEADGDWRFIQRHALFTDAVYTTVQATFADDGTGIGFRDVVLDPDDYLLASQVRVNRANGGIKVATDDTAKDRFGLRELPSRGQSLVADDNQASDEAHYLLNRHKTPAERVRRIVVRPTTAADWATVLGLELGHRVAVKLGGLTAEHHVEGIDHDGQIRGDERTWDVTLTLSPADTTDYWILGTSELGTDTVAGY